MTRGPATSPAPAADGRVRRTERSRAAILQALSDLVRAGELSPSAHRVAVRAGVGVRTVFRHFSEMETLFAEMNQRLLAELQPLRDERPPDGDLGVRLRTLVERRAAIFERIAPYRRSGDVHRWRSPYLQRQHRAATRAMRGELVAWMPELAGAPAGRLDGLDLLLSFEAWDRLRSQQGLSPKRTRAVIEQVALSLVADLPARSHRGTTRTRPRERRRA